MNNIEYLPLDALHPAAFLPLLNKPKLRTHLIRHQLFDIQSARAWLDSKLGMDARPGCKVRAVLVKGELAGWCGIQQEAGLHEIALVIDDGYWGLGKLIFRDMMVWARELGHTTVFIHLLHTRRQYRFLRRLASKVHESELMGNSFTTYELSVNQQ